MHSSAGYFLGMQRQTAPQPQAQAQELTAGHIVGGSTNEIHAPQQDRNTANKHIHTLYCIPLCLTMLAGFTLGISPHCEPEGPLGP